MTTPSPFLNVLETNTKPGPIGTHWFPQVGTILRAFTKAQYAAGKWANDQPYAVARRVLGNLTKNTTRQELVDGWVACHEGMAHEIGRLVKVVEDMAKKQTESERKIYTLENAGNVAQTLIDHLRAELRRVAAERDGLLALIAKPTPPSPDDGNYALADNSWK